VEHLTEPNLNHMPGMLMTLVRAESSFIPVLDLLVIQMGHRVGSTWEGSSLTFKFSTRL
jgi:hypothetical protein